MMQLIYELISLIDQELLTRETMGRILHFLPLKSEDTETQDWSLVCVCRALKQYVQATKDIRQDTFQLFVTYHQGRQGKPASKAMIAGWIK